MSQRDTDVIRCCPFHKTRSLFTRRVREREFLFFSPPLTRHVFKGGPLANAGGFAAPAKRCHFAVRASQFNVSCLKQERASHPSTMQNELRLSSIWKSCEFLLCTRCYTLIQEKFLCTTLRNSTVIYEEIKLHYVYMYIRVEGIRKENGVKTEVNATA